MAKKDLMPEVERLYVIEGKTFTRISELLGISKQTLSGWKKKLDLGRKRKAFLSTPRAIADSLQEVLRAKVEEIAKMEALDVTPPLLDGLHKLIKSVKNIRRETDPLAEAVNTFDRFSLFVAERELKPQVRERLASLMQEFFERLAKGEYE